MSAGSNVVASLQQTLAADEKLEELHQYISEGTHLDLSAAWTTAVQANDGASSTAICKAISQVLIKIDGERGFTSSGSAFIRRVLAEHARSILRNLSSLRPMYVNPTLRLLITMAQFDAGALSNDVYLSFDFSTFKVLPKLLTRTGPQTQKPKDERVTLGKRKRDDHSSKDATRGLFIALLFTLLNRAPTSAKAEIIQRRPIMQELAKYLSSDPDESIIKTLKGFQTIIENREIPRPAKVQCFNETMLSHLSALYSHTSEDQSEDTELADVVDKPAHESGEQSEDENLGSTSGAEDGTMPISPVRKALQEFFLVATTIPDQGVCFASKDLVPPANKKLYNPILGSFILTLDVDDKLQASLLIAITKSTPELVAHWFQGAKIDFTPCLEVTWIQRMQTLEAIASGELSQDTVTNLQQIPDFVIIENILPTPLANIATKGLRHESALVNLMTCRTLSNCLNALRPLRIEDDRAHDLTEQIQKQAPLIETILPLATATVTAGTPEVEVLLRRAAIATLELYVTVFVDLPNFDFVRLFDMILNSKAKNPPGIIPDSDSGKDLDFNGDEPMEDDDVIDDDPDWTYATGIEQGAVLLMARHIEGLPWLTKRGGSRSMLGNVLKCMSRSLYAIGALAAETMWKIIVADSIAFSTTSPTVVSPTSKILAFFRAFPRDIDDPAVDEEQIDTIITFIEDCMARFQASPHKYWDQLMDLCTEHGLSMNCDLSLILFTLKEQLEFVVDKPYIQDWYESVLMQLVDIGEDKAICEVLLEHPLPTIRFSQEPSLWNAVKVAFAIYNGAVSDEELDPEASYSDGNDSEKELTWESGDSWLSLHWTVLLNACNEMPDGDSQQYKDFVVDLWSTKSEMDQSEAAQILNFITTWYEKSDTASNRKLNTLIERLLLLSTESPARLESVLTTQQVQCLATKLLDQSQDLPSTLKGSLLDGLMDKQEAANSTALFMRMFTADDFHHESVLRSLTNALKRKALNYIPLQEYICAGNNEVLARCASTSEKSQIVQPSDVAACIIAYFANYDAPTVPEAFVKWATSADFVDASMVISELLLSKVQEAKETGLRVLEVQQINMDTLVGRHSPTQEVLRCLRAKIKLNTSVQAELIKSVLERVDFAKPLDNGGIFAILSALEAGSCDSLDSEISKQLSAYHVKLVEYVTRQLAENRAEENKKISFSFCDSLKQLAPYIESSARFPVDVGRPMLDTMGMAAIDNQLRVPEVLELLVGVAKSSTTEEVFNYARTIQAILSRSLLLESEKVQLMCIKLLHVLILYNPSRANLNVMDEVLKLYTGTLVIPDLMLFDILCALEKSLGISIGTRMKSWRLLESLNDRTIDRSKTDAIISSELAQFTISHFAEHDTVVPTDARIKKLFDIDSIIQSFEWSQEEMEDRGFDKPTEAAKIYDLRYMIPLIAGYMHADPSYSMLKQLLDHHAIGLTFLGLASKDLVVRQQSSQLLSKFDAMIQSSTIRERAQLSTIFQVVKNSISADSIRDSPIPLVHAVFLGQATHIMLVPAHFLYEKMNRFLLARPQLDFNDIPMFLNLFNSHEGYVKHVTWIINLLAAGLRGNREENGNSYARRHVLEMCMGLYNAKTASTRIKEAIKDLLFECVRSEEMKWYFERVGGPTWLAMTDDDALKEIRDVFQE